MIIKPTKEDLLAATNKGIQDVIKPKLKVLFCGINPGLYTAAVGHHFGRPGNRYWKALYGGGFTPRLFHPSEQESLLDLGYGITNLVNRASVGENDLSQSELVLGGIKLARKLKTYRTEWVVFVGIGSYRIAFTKPKAKIGLQDEKISDTKVWVLPNPSGLNAHYPQDKLNHQFKLLNKAVRLIK
jgi:double-stranded uracil-DNA glycosylase